MSNIKRSVPWLNVIKFHKEIASRAEESFFSLPVNNLESERWSSINIYEPDSLSGPWQFDRKSIISNAFLRKIRMNEKTEVFIGGPCWIKWKKDSNFELRPLLYREIKIRFDESKVTLTPEQGKWEISPLVFNFLEQKGIVTEKPIEELIPELIENAYEMSNENGSAFTKTLIMLLERSIHELGEILCKDFPKNRDISVPSKWILFNSPTNFSAYTRNLLKDYIKLENIIVKDPQGIGGLRLLEDIGNLDLDDENFDVLPIVPLNESQKEAVSGILGNKPVTVVSGPPGCGKSQVVLSVILNAWASGKSVLFVSNNNQAVDVVRKRLKSFEQDFPIAVRAGSKKVSNLNETLRRIINGISNWKRISGDGSMYLRAQEKLISEKYELENLMNSQVPQRIDQLMKSALNAYSKSTKHMDVIKNIVLENKNKLKDLGYDNIEPGNFKTTVVDKFEKWIDLLYEYKENDTDNKLKLCKLQDELDKETIKRDLILNDTGISTTEMASFNCLLDGIGLNSVKKWYDKFKEMIENPIEKSLLPVKWDEGYNEWSNEEELSQWIAEASDLPETIRNLCSDLSEKISYILKLKEQYEEKRIELRNNNLDENINISEEVFSKWIDEYKELTLLPNSKLDWMPWSRKKKIISNIAKLETEMRPQFSLSIWKQVSPLDQLGREKLSKFIEIINGWIVLRNSWNDKENERKHIEKCFENINAKLFLLKFNHVNNVYDISSWLDLSMDIKNKLVFAQKAKVNYQAREIYDRTVNQIKIISMEYKDIGAGIPIFVVWTRNKGKEFNDAVLGAGLYIESEDIINLRRLMYSGVFDHFILSWKNAIQNQTNIISLTKNIDSIPTTKSLAISWWEKEPQEIQVIIKKHDEFPKENAPILNHYTECIELLTDWNKISMDIIKDEDLKYQNEINWAREKLNDVLELIPMGSEKEKISSNITQFINRKDNWEVDRILNSIKSYVPERIIAKLDSLSSRLRDISFNAAKAKQLKAFSADVDAQDSLDVLYDTYIKNGDQLTDNAYSHFINALRAVPIWITTTQSPQSIPMLPEIFDVLVVDEATQCTLTNILPLVYRAKRIAVIGDIEQLTAIPTIGNISEQILATKYKVEEYSNMFGHYDNNFYKTAIRCLPKRNGDVISLNEHYRSHPLIIGFSNYYVYNSSLVLKKNPEDVKEVPFGSGVFGYNVSGLCSRGQRGESWINKKEVDTVCEIVKMLKNDDKFGNISIGIVSPFKAQTIEISDKLEKYGLINEITIDTVHKYQGDERDIIIFSSVVSKGITEDAARWVENPPNLINVAVTRAREALFVVGDFNVCKQQRGILGNLVKYVENINILRNTSQYELDLFSWMIVQGWRPEVHPRIGDIEVDFVLRNNKNGIKIVIEVDGSQHDFQKVQDQSRDQFLISKGYIVLRFSTREINEMPAEVINRIKQKFENEQYN